MIQWPLGQGLPSKSLFKAETHVGLHLRSLYCCPTLAELEACLYFTETSQYEVSCKFVEPFSTCIRTQRNILKVILTSKLVGTFLQHSDENAKYGIGHLDWMWGSQLWTGDAVWNILKHPKSKVAFWMVLVSQQVHRTYIIYVPQLTAAWRSSTEGRCNFATLHAMFFSLTRPKLSERQCEALDVFHGLQERILCLPVLVKAASNLYCRKKCWHMHDLFCLALLP